MRIVHADNLMLRRYGYQKVSTGRRHFYGMIRNNWQVYEYSERDIAKFEAPLGIKPLGKRKANKKFIETCDNFRPDVILIGHSDLISNHTLKEIKRLLPDCPLIYRNLDPLWRSRNVDTIQWRAEVMDCIFVTTSGPALKQFTNGHNLVGYIPNATDPGMDINRNHEKTSFERDLIFVGRGQTTDDRYAFLKELDSRLAAEDNLNFESYGLYGKPGIYGHAYDMAIASTKMGLNLNRYEGWPLYSSDRIAQLMGNGLLTFLWDKGNMRHFFSENEVVFFANLDELVKKVCHFHHDDAHRQAVASAGHSFYHHHFSGAKVTRYMVETALQIPYTEEYLWQDQIFQ